MQHSFYRLLARRLSAAALVIALVLGGAVYLYEVEQIDETVVALAWREAGAFAALDGGEVPLGDRLKAFLAAREHGFDGHFVFAEIYDGGRKALAEASRGDVAAVEAAFDRSTHPFPTDGRAHYDKVTLDGRLYLRVLTDLRSGGFFEGIFAVAPERLDHIRENVFGSVAIVVAVVAGTTLFLLPIVVGLNRHLVSLSERLLRANVEILEVLGGAIAKRDSDTSQHNFRVTLYAVRLAEELGLDRVAIRALIKGAFLHDVGKIAIGDAILLKPGKLTEEEFAVMKTHVDHGVDIVRHSRWLDDAAP
ncbi:MAG TPA: HD domain-containing protein, partial [Azospirillum sp.]|nr:HD domain-containing protein [Azospirillum sp.]